jgi:MoxR-like ATPase
MSSNDSWRAFTGKASNKSSDLYKKIAEVSPPWRNFSTRDSFDEYRAKTYVFDPDDEEDKRVLNLINAALYLQRPMLIKGPAGVGKSSLAYLIAEELELGKVLVWPITSRSTVKDALYKYEILRQLASIIPPTRPVSKPNNAKGGFKQKEYQLGEFFTLRQLGIAIANPEKSPRVLLVDEIDKADMDLPNDLLHVLEEGKFQIEELVSKRKFDDQNLPTIISFENGKEIAVDENGWIYRNAYPVIVMTSNGEREFPEPFLRRCITIELKAPKKEKLIKIMHQHFREWKNDPRLNMLIDKFAKSNQISKIPTDKLLNAFYLLLNSKYDPSDLKEDDGKLISEFLDEIMGINSAK